MPNTYYSKSNRVVRPIIRFAHSGLNDDSFFCAQICIILEMWLWSYLLLRDRDGSKKISSRKTGQDFWGSMVSESGWQNNRQFFKSHSSDCKRNVEQTIHPPWYSNDLIEFPVYHQWNIKVSVHPHTGKSLRADFRFLPWNRSVVFWIGTFTLIFRRNASSMLPIFSKWWSRTDWWWVTSIVLI